MTDDSTAARSARSLWGALGGDPEALASLGFTGPTEILPSRFAVTPFAAAAVGVATLAVSELHGARSGDPAPPAEVDTWASSAAFRSEALFAPIGWERPGVWDPLAGDYLAKDRCLRLHTNYAAHRAAVLAVLELADTADRGVVAEAVGSWEATALEAAVVAKGGCAAVMYTREEWSRHEHGQLTGGEAPVSIVTRAAEGPARARHREGGSTRPLQGVRVLDLSRVLAGPVCTRFLAAYGAEVLRLDPPGFEEVPALLPDVTAGKHCAFLDLRSPKGVAAFFDLLAEADVLVTGYRPGALEALGLSHAVLSAHRPDLVHASFDAYGWKGPWRERRGFDSLVQMSTGIAASAAGPAPLPAQALDHGLGYLIAAGVCRALALREATGAGALVRGSLLGVANHLFALPPQEAPLGTAPAWPKEVFENAPSAWGNGLLVRCPGRVIGVPEPSWRIPAGPLGASPPRWQKR